MEATFSLRKSELMFDAMNETHLAAKDRVSHGMASKEAYAVQASEDSPDSSKLLSSMKQAIFSFQSAFSSLSRNPRIVYDNDDIVMTVNVSPRFDTGYVPVIESLFHGYVVSMMLYDWFVITDAQRAAAYMAHAQKNLSESLAAFVKNPPRRP